MRNLTVEEKAVFDAYMEKENQRIEPMPLRNVGRFFVDDTTPENFIQDYIWLKEMVLESFLLLKPEQRPDGDFLHDVLCGFDLFIEELKVDAEKPQPESIKNDGCLALGFMPTISVVTANYMKGWITEKQASKQFIKAVKANWRFNESGFPQPMPTDEHAPEIQSE